VAKSGGLLVGADPRSPTWPVAAKAPALLQRHYDALRRGSGITDDVIRERAYRSALGEQELADLGFSPAQRRPPGLLLPVWTPDGQNPLALFRPDLPRRDRRGRELKYEVPAGAGVRLDVPPRCRSVLGDPSVPLWITEGIKKADALASAGLCAVALLGVWNFKGKNSRGGVTLLADFDYIALNGRYVRIVFDSDAARKLEVRGALERLAEHLRRRGAVVKAVLLPDRDDPGGAPAKVGVDDYLLGQTVADLEALVCDLTPVAPGADRQRLADEVPVCATPRLPAFTARIDGPASGSVLIGHYPASEPVDGTALVCEVEGFIARYVVLPEGAALAVTAWILTTYALDAFDTHPILAITSPEKRCGKTRLLELLELLCARPVRVAGISEAALFRIIEAERPTLLIDEAQALRARDDRSAALHDLLCAGNRRGSKVYRVGGPNRDRLDAFSTFAPKALACIGELADVITDRAIRVRMRRRAPGESVERFLFTVAEAEAAPVRARLAQWAADHVVAVQTAYGTEVLPAFLADREAENWMPLFAVIRLADPCKLSDLEAAARALAGAKAEDATPSAGVRLLGNIRAVFGEREGEFIASADLIEALHGIEESPWRDWRRGRGLSAEALARLLKPFGVRPRRVRRGETLPRGYDKASFVDAWSRYLPFNLEHPEQFNQDAASGDLLNPEQAPRVPGSQNGASPRQEWIVPGVPGQAPIMDTVPDFPGDDGRRMAVWQSGETFGWPQVPFAPGHSIAPGRDAWLVFLRANSDEVIVQAWKALEGFSGGAPS
jgi:hypothetical protein